jgi:Mor family transcriptional regulator
MKVFEALFCYKEALTKLSAMGVRLEDYRYMELYEEYLSLCADGSKKTYIVAILAEKYHISQRHVYALVRRLKSDCTTLAAVPSTI